MKFHITVFDKAAELYVYRDEPECMHALADLYWHLLLAFLGVVTACTLLYGMWQLSTTLNPRSADDASATPAPEILQRDQLTALLDSFAARRAAYDTLKNNPPRATDPAK